MINRSYTKGFNLIELMIVVTIIGILAAVGIPSYRDYIDKTNRVDAMGALTAFANAMERYYAVNDTYRGVCSGDTSADESDCAPAAAVFPSQSPLDSSTKVYDLMVESATATYYKLNAIAIDCAANNIHCGEITLDSTGAREWDQDKSGSISADESDWESN